MYVCACVWGLGGGGGKGWDQKVLYNKHSFSQQLEHFD